LRRIRESDHYEWDLRDVRNEVPDERECRPSQDIENKSHLPVKYDPEFDRDLINRPSKATSDWRVPEQIDFPQITIHFVAAILDQ
jgi:hypothetical protein